MPGRIAKRYGAAGLIEVRDESSQVVLLAGVGGNCVDFGWARHRVTSSPS
jgi:hypothetical protein